MTTQTNTTSIRAEQDGSYAKYIECRWCHWWENYSPSGDYIYAFDLRDAEYFPERQTLLAIHLDCEEEQVDRNMNEDRIAGFTVRSCTNCKHWEAYHNPSCEKLFWDPVFKRPRSCGCACSIFEE